MTEAEEKEIQAIVQNELLGIIRDAQELLSPMKDPTGLGKKALEGLANVIRRRAPSRPDHEKERTPSRKK